MRNSRFSPDQVVGILKEAEAGTALAELCRRGISQQTFYRWKAKYDGLEISEARDSSSSRTKIAAPAGRCRSDARQSGPQAGALKKL